MDRISEGAKVAHLFHEVMVIFRQNANKVFEDSGITASHGMVLSLLKREKKVKITELSSKLNLPNSTVSGLVDRLEKLGMVVRERSEEDRRVVYVSISPCFKDVHQQLQGNLYHSIENMMNLGSPEDLQTILKGLHTLKALLLAQRNF